MHVGSCMVFAGAAPAYDGVRRAARAAPAPRPALPPEAGLPAAAPGAPGVGRRPALQRGLSRPPHRAPAAGGRRTSCAALAGRRLLAAARPRQAAVGAVARRARRRGPLRARSPRRTTASSTASRASTSPRCCSTSSPSPPPAPPAEPVGPAPRAVAPRRCWSDALRELAAAPVELARAAGDAIAHPRRAAAAGAAAVGGLGALALAGLGARAALAAQRPHRPAPALRVGRRRPGASSRRSRTALGGTVNDVVLAVVAGALRDATCERHGDDVGGLDAQGDGARLRARRRRARGAGQPRGGGLRAAAGRRSRDPIARFRAVHEAMRGLKASGQAVGAERMAALAGFALPHRPLPGRAAAGASALLQPHRHERAGPAGPALHARPPAARALSARAAGGEHRARASRSCPTTAASTSGS